MLDRRVQILLTRHLLVARLIEAERRGVSVAAVVRDAIDRLPSDGERRRAAIAAVFAAEPTPMPAGPAELRRELDAAHG
jgi:hypothetical protein